MIKSILIIKLGAAGDVLRTTCILQGLDETYPEAKITWVTKGKSIALLQNNPLIDELVTIGNFDTSKKFDFVINLDEDEMACKLASTMKGDKFKGFYWDDGVKYTEAAEQWYMMSALGPRPMNDRLKKQNAKTYQQHMLGIIGIRPSKHETLYFLTDEEKVLAGEFRKSIKAKLVIGLNTGSGGRWPLKRLSVRKTVELANRLSKKATIVLFGGPEEKERNKEIMDRASCNIVDAGTGNTLREFAAKLSSVDLLITSDTLALHLGIALKRKIVAFFGPTSASEVEMYGLGEKVHANVECYCCYKKEPIAQPSCADAITVDMIIDAVKRVIG